MASFNTPTDEQVAELLTNLIGRSVTVTEGHPPLPGEFVVTKFCYDDDEPAVNAYCDLRVASALGAALALVPASKAAECAIGGLDEELLCNVAEVFNVCASLFSRNGGAHIRSSGTDAETVIVLPEARWRLPLEVEVEGYGKGKLCFQG